MEFYIFRKPDDPHMEEFRTLAVHHNMRTAKFMSLILGLITFVLYLLDMHTDTEKVLRYPGEYAAAINFILASSVACYLAFTATRLVPEEEQPAVQQLLGHAYAIVVLVASLWLTFSMQHNPANTMSIFVLGLIAVAALWVFEEWHAILLTILLLICFCGGLHYFQTDPCKLFTNYITGACVSIFFLCISRINFSINYNHFRHIKQISRDSADISRINALQTEILAVVAHDLHAPINNVITIIDMLRQPGTTDEERAEFYDLILTTCRRSDVIIDELLTVSRQNEQDICFTETNVNAFIGDMVHYFIYAKKAAVNIIYTPPGKALFADINKPRLMRVFDNLISNAMKFTTDDGIINIDLEHDNEHVMITIRDNGIGIPKAMLPGLFSRFSKAGRTGLNGQKSYGLGLSICKLIMTEHKGDIFAESEEGSGTTMVLTLPLLKEQEN